LNAAAAGLYVSAVISISATQTDASWDSAR